MEKLTDKHIQAQALQHLLIHYEKKYDKYKELDRDDILKNFRIVYCKD